MSVFLSPMVGVSGVYLSSLNLTSPESFEQSFISLSQLWGKGKETISSNNLSTLYVNMENQCAA